MRKVYLLGAGYATQLMTHVNEEVDGHPLWISRFVKTEPDAIKQTYLDYLNAGTDVIDSLTYQASIPGFMKCFGLNESDSYDLMKETVRIARTAIEEYMKNNPEAERPLINGGAGSYGACLNDGSEYTGSFVDKVKMNDVMDWHRPRVKALIEEGVDFISFVTIPAMAEARVLIKLMKEFPDQKFWISFQCKDSERTAYGDNFEDSLKECWEIAGDQLIAVGCNCVNPKFVTPMFRKINQPGNVKYPLVAFPNSGEEFSAGKGWHGTSKWDKFEDMVSEWLDLGVMFLGSCCRTDISYIGKNKAVLEQWLRRRG